MRLFLVLVAATLAVSLSFATEPDKSKLFILEGAIVMPGKTYVTIRDVASGNLIRWIPVGSSIRENVVVRSYNPDRSTITLMIGTDPVELRMVDGRIGEDKSAPKLLRGTFTVRAGGVAVSAVTDQLWFGTTSRIYAGPGKILEVTPSVMEDGNWMFAATLIATDTDGKVTKSDLGTIVALPDNSFSIQVQGVIGFSFKP